jgi:glucose/arabinose dehydrogenase
MFIDISDRVGDSGGERGLFGIAFEPDFGTNGRAYLSYTRSAPSLTSYVSRFTSNDGGLTLDAASEVVLLALPQPFSNHNGGHIAFGPDDLLYVAFGDGGSGDDPGNRAQDTTNLFGTIIRIDVTALPYTIPPGNPFAGNPRCPTGSSNIDCPEIYAYGLRNPWRFSFDRNTGELWAADVGQGAWEEVDRIVAGGNYGWRIREGAHCNIPASGCTTVGLIDPVSEYDHDLGQSVTGGYVYRGGAITALRGDYLFGDFVTGVILRAVDGAGPPEVLLDSGLNPSSFGEDAAGELFVVSYSDGALYRVVAAP